jgi:chemotaxis protein CheZ
LPAAAIQSGVVVPASVVQTAITSAAGIEDIDALRTRLNTARSEIEAALTEAKRAAETIIERAEQLLALSAEPAVGDAGIGILEACGFQDLTGQRLKKALAQLDRIVAEIEQKDFGLGLMDEDPAYAAWQTANLVHGPASPHEALGQDAIDDIFNSVK